MIIDFTVRNFGSIKNEQTLSFEAKSHQDLEHYHVMTVGKMRLLKIGVIYGPNASGKTTVLRALEFLRRLALEPLEKKTQEFGFHPFEFDEESKSQSSTLSINFIQNDTRYFYSVEFNKYAILTEELYKYNPNKSKVFSRSTDLEKQFTRINFGDKIRNKNATANKILTANTLWNNSVLGGSLKTNIEIGDIKEVHNWFSSYLHKVILPESDLDGYILKLIDENDLNKTDIVQILKKADLHISDIVISEEESDIPDGLLEFLEKQVKAPKDQVKELKERGKITSVDLEIEHTVGEKKYKLPMDRESKGTNRFFGLAGVLALLVKKSVLFPIDELEASLHPDLFFYFILSFLVNSQRSQLLCTTHNRELLNNRDLFRNDSIWFTDKEEECSTILYSLSDFKSKTIRDTSNVYNAYKIGKLGAVPKLSDYYLDFSDENR